VPAEDQARRQRDDHYRNVVALAGAIGAGGPGQPLLLAPGGMHPWRRSSRSYPLGTLEVLVSREVMAVINCVGLPMSGCRPANLATLHRNTAPRSRMPAIGVATRNDVRPGAQSILAIPNSTVMQASGAQRIEANPASENAWVRHVNDVADSTLYPLANSWYVGANIPGKRVCSCHMSAACTATRSAAMRLRRRGTRASL
jgi:hypothetical protein